MGAPLRFTPIGAAASAGRLGAGSGIGSTQIPLNPEMQAALGQYHGPGSGGGAGMQGMDAGQEWSAQSSVTRRRYGVAIVALMVIFVVGPVVLLKMLGLL